MKEEGGEKEKDEEGACEEVKEKEQEEEVEEEEEDEFVQQRNESLRNVLGHVNPRCENCLTLLKLSLSKA
jgi:hypothetical protein